MFIQNGLEYWLQNELLPGRREIISSVEQGPSWESNSRLDGQQIPRDKFFQGDWSHQFGAFLSIVEEISENKFARF
jgi:hypothetical protein